MINIERKDVAMSKAVFTWMFFCGLLVVITAAALLLLNVIESGIAAMIGIVGIGLIAASGRSKIKKG
jgi:hypothetical protein